MAANDEIFLKNCWYVAAWDHELIDGTKLARTILEQPVVLYRGESGRVMAMEDRCCHRGAPLSDKAIIEAQQRLFDREPETQLLAIAADAALAHFRRIFGQRLAAERAAMAAAA